MVDQSQLGSANSVQINSAENTEINSSSIKALNNVFLKSDEDIKVNQGMAGDGVEILADSGMAQLNSGKSIQLNQADIKGGYVGILADEDLSLGQQLRLTAQKTEYMDSDASPFEGSDAKLKEFNGNLLIKSGGDIKLTSEHELSASGDLSLLAQDFISITDMPDFIASSIVIKTQGPDGQLASGDIDIRGTNLKAVGSEALLNISSAGDLSVNNSDLSSDKDLYIDADSDVQILGSRMNAGETLSLESGDNLKVSAGSLTKTNLTAGDFVTIRSGEDLSIDNADIRSSYVEVLAERSADLKQNVDLSTYNSSKEGLGERNGDLLLKAESGLDISSSDTQINAAGDLTIFSETGDVKLEGVGGTQGIGSAVFFALTSGKDINLFGRSVSLSGAELIANNGDVNLRSTQGDILITPLKNTFENYISTDKKVKNLNNLLVDSLQDIEDYESLLNDLNLKKSNLDYVHEQISESSDGKQIVTTTNKNLLDEYLRYRSSPITTEEEKTAKAQIKEDIEAVLASDFDGKTWQDFETEVQSLNARFLQVEGTLEDLNELIEIVEGDIKVASTTASDGYEHKETLIKASGKLNLNAEGGIFIQGSHLQGDEAVNILAKGVLSSQTDEDLRVAEEAITDPDETLNSSIMITGVMDQYQAGEPEDANFWLSKSVDRTEILSSGDINIVSLGTDVDKSNLILNGVKAESTSGDINIRALNGNVRLEASQNTDIIVNTVKKTKRSWTGKKKTKITRTEIENSTAAGVTLKADDISIEASHDIKTFGTEFLPSTLDRGNIQLVAGDKVTLLAVEETYDKDVEVKKTSSWLGFNYSKSKSKSSRLELDNLVTTIVAEYSGIESGDDIELEGTEFNTLQGASLQAGVGPNAKEDAQIIFRGVQDQVITSYEYESENLVWFKNEGEGATVTTLRIPSFTQTPYISAPGGIIIDVGVDVSPEEAKQHIALSQEELGNLALELATQPGFEYLADLDQQNAINWQAVQLIQDSWDYEAEGLTAAAAVLISLAVAVATAGTGLAGASAAFVGAGSSGAVATGVAAGFTGLYSQAAVTLINNKGDIGATLDQMASSETVRSFAVAALTAGVAEQLNLTLPESFQGSGISDQIVRGTINSLGQAAINSAINGADFEQALKTALIDSLVNVGQGYAAQGLHRFDTNFLIDNLVHKIGHALAGCAAAELKQADCGSGAVGAAVGEMYADYMIGPDDQIMLNGTLYSVLEEGEGQSIRDYARLLAGSAALVLDMDPSIAAQSADVAVQNNGLKNLLIRGPILEAFLALNYRDDDRNDLVVDNNTQAVEHYYNGNGEAVHVGPRTIRVLQTSSRQLEAERNLTSGNTNMNGSYRVNITFGNGSIPNPFQEGFQIGRTGVAYQTHCSVTTCQTTFTGFVQTKDNIVIGPDGFRDVLDIGQALNISDVELPTGTAYDYIPYSWSMEYERPENFDYD